MPTNQINFGFPNEWQAFSKRNRVLMEKLHLLFETVNKTFIRQVQTHSPAERIVLFLGRLCIEDFMEILLLCGNGYGVGGMKLLRGLYERAVTLGYIAKNPQKAEQFLEYHYVHRGKQFNHAKSLLKKSLPSEMIEEIQDTYNKAKRKYQEVVCKKCGTSRTRFSWSELDLPSMAHKVGLERLYRECYYEPTLQAHATVSSLMTRMRISDNGQVAFDESAGHEWVDPTLVGAHNIILRVLDMENSYFKMGLEKEIQERSMDFKLVWDSETSERFKL